MDKESVNRGLQLRFVREYRKYSQEQLALKIKGLSQSNLSKFEKGFKGTISNELQAVIMKFLDWPSEWLDLQTPNRHVKI